GRRGRGRGGRAHRRSGRGARSRGHEERGMTPSDAGSAPRNAYAGAAHVVGDNVDTDRIIPGKYTKTLDTSQLAAHLLEDYDPQLVSRLQQGDVLVAGENFGCGSSREQA